MRLLESTLTDVTLQFEDLFQKRLLVLKKKFIESAENIFSHTKSNIHNEIRQSDYFHFKQVEETKTSLVEANTKLKKMKSEMEVNWKKVAG